MPEIIFFKIDRINFVVPVTAFDYLIWDLKVLRFSLPNL